MTKSRNRGGPHPGMQARMMASPATICGAGARAGVGKSWGLLLCPTMYVARRLPATCVIFRRRRKDLHGNTSIVGKAERLYRPLGAAVRFSPSPDFRWQWRDGRTAVEFGALPELSTVNDYQGVDFDFIGFDELTHFHLDQFDYLRSRLRSQHATGVRAHLRLTLNPIADGWIRQLFDWWIGEDGYPIREREGKLRWMIAAPDDWPSPYIVDTREELLRMFPKSRPLSLTLIPGRPEDNPTQDWAAYTDQLSNLPPHLRASLLEGNWNVGPEDPARIWDMPLTCPFKDDDPDFQRFLANAGRVDLYGAWDYGRARHGLSWVLGAIEPGPKPVLWIIGARVWTGASAEQAAQERLAFLETLDLPLVPGDIREAGDPSGWARDSAGGWARTLRSHGVPLVDLRHSMGEERSKVYWNSPAGFALTTDLVQSWMTAGRLRIRIHPSTKPLLEAVRNWRLAVPDGSTPIQVNRDQLPPDKGVHSHPGDTLRYLVAFVAAMLRAHGQADDVTPANDIVAHAAAMRVARIVGNRGGGISAGAW